MFIYKKNLENETLLNSCIHFNSDVYLVTAVLRGYRVLRSASAIIVQKMESMYSPNLCSTFELTIMGRYDAYSAIASPLVWMPVARSCLVEPTESGQQRMETEGVGWGNKNDWPAEHLIMEVEEEAVHDVT